MSKTVSSWFGRTHSKSLSKDLNKQETQSSEQDKENKENGSDHDAKLTKCESLPSNLISFESDDDAEEPEPEFNAELGPLVSLKEQLEKDKEDESLRRQRRRRGRRVRGARGERAVARGDL
jgi:hypothetical protein